MTTHEAHAATRIVERLTDAGFDHSAIAHVFETARSIAPRLRKATAVLLLTLPGAVNEAWGDRSNGNEVWAVYRGRELRTVFLRRSTQPSTPDAFGVESVLRIAPHFFTRMVA
jgi:ribosome-interacting GTPase 1